MFNMESDNEIYGKSTWKKMRKFQKTQKVKIYKFEFKCEIYITSRSCVNLMCGTYNHKNF